MFTCATQKYIKIRIVQRILISEKTENFIQTYGLKQENGFLNKPQKKKRNGNKWQIGVTRRVLLIISFVTHSNYDIKFLPLFC